MNAELLFVTSKGEEMQRVDVHQFYELAINVHPLTELREGLPLKEIYYSLIMGRVWLDWLLQNRILPMEICRDTASKTVEGISRLIPLGPPGPQQEQADLERIPNTWEIYAVSNPARQFEIVFAAELKNVATYFVSEKSIYDTNRLIERGDELFPESVRSNFSDQVKQDLREAGKCLAFDLSTAAGFHIARAVEGVLLPYLSIVDTQITANLKDSDRNLGNYIKLLKAHGGDDKICTALTQFKDLHRNPLIHPETSLTIDEALTLLGIAQSSIVAMVADGNKRKQAAGP